MSNEIIFHYMKIYNKEVGVICHDGDQFDNVNEDKHNEMIMVAVVVVVGSLYAIN